MELTKKSFAESFTPHEAFNAVYIFQQISTF